MTSHVYPDYLTIGISESLPNLLRIIENDRHILRAMFQRGSGDPVAYGSRKPSNPSRQKDKSNLSIFVSELDNSILLRLIDSLGY